MAEEIRKRRRGRPAGRREIPAWAVRITFENEQDKDDIIDWIDATSKGIPVGRYLRNIVRERMECHGAGKTGD